MGDPLQNSRLCYTVCLRRKHLCVTLQMTLGSHRKRSGVLFVLFVEAQRYILEQIDQGATTGQLVSSQGVFRQRFRFSSRQIDERSEQKGGRWCSDPP